MNSILVAVATVLVIVHVGIAWAWRARAAFEAHFPPISDDEFLALCRPGIDPTVALKVRRLVADHFAIEYARVHPSMSFVEDIGAD